MPHSANLLLYFLQRFTNRANQIKQLHSLLITNGHLLPNPKSKWMGTLLYNALIRTNPHPHKAIQLFTHMLAHQAPPNNYTFPSLIKAASSSLSLASVSGRPLHAQALKRGLSLDPFVQTSFVRMYAQLSHLRDAHHVFEEISDPCIVSCNAMLDAYGRNGEMGSAVLLFGSMRERDVFSWTSVIDGFGRNGCCFEAIKFFEKMMGHEDVVSCIVRPSEATFVSVLTSCAKLDGKGALCQGRQVHAYIIKSQIELTVYMGTALISFYGKLGSLAIAIEVFNGMGVKEVCTWNAVISSLASNGRENQALAMFLKMMMRGVDLNEVTFVAALTACARAKFVELGLDIFHAMTHDFRIVPRMEHYGCLIDLLGRAGLLNEATEILSKMPFEPDATVLGALLGACKLHGAMELGNDVGRRLLVRQPWHCGRYVVLSNIYAGAERWGNAAELRKEMVEAGIHKVPAHSLVYHF